MKVASPLLEKVELALRCLRIGAGGVVAVSGGPDSVALLRALLALRPIANPGALVFAHLNHQLRGEESDADEAFVRKLNGTFIGVGNLELRCDRLDVATRAHAEGVNLEDMARRLRYDWLARVAGEAGASWVATGHTKDDQAETILHRLVRGAGLKGLRGIALRRPLAPGIELVRPLLAVTRAEVLAYLQAEGQEYRQDSSNADLHRTRNRIRHELLPLLKESYNPAIVSVLGRLAEQAEETYRVEEGQARQLLAEAELPRAGALLVFHRQALAAAPRHCVRELFRLVWEREGWPLGDMDFDAWGRLAAVALGESTAVDLPGGIRARCRERVVQIGRGL